jgi:hypothetical protein
MKLRKKYTYHCSTKRKKSRAFKAEVISEAWRVLGAGLMADGCGAGAVVVVSLRSGTLSFMKYCQLPVACINEWE